MLASYLSTQTVPALTESSGQSAAITGLTEPTPTITLAAASFKKVLIGCSFRFEKI
jgi:hypothetical protein